LFKRSCFAAAVGLAMLAGFVAAAAQTGSGICTVARTCSEAFFQCVAVNCPRYASAGCGGACRAQFDGCMRTGTFGGPDCRDKTLTRK
jgi:hypothetical protein